MVNDQGQTSRSPGPHRRNASEHRQPQRQTRRSGEPRSQPQLLPSLEATGLVSRSRSSHEPGPQRPPRLAEGPGPGTAAILQTYQLGVVSARTAERTPCRVQRLVEARRRVGERAGVCPKWAKHDEPVIGRRTVTRPSAVGWRLHIDTPGTAGILRIRCALYEVGKERTLVAIEGWGGHCGRL
jgi:hypothetical protein